MMVATSECPRVLNLPGEQLAIAQWCLEWLETQRDMVDSVHETILNAHIVTNKDRDMKFKQFEEFVDSKSYCKFFEAVEDLRGHKLHCFLTAEHRKACFHSSQDIKTPGACNK